MLKRLLDFISDYFYYIYICNPIMNPSVVSVEDIKMKARNGRMVKGYRLSTRKHAFDRWTVIGDFRTMEEVLNAIH